MSENTERAFWVHEAGQGEIRSRPARTPDANEVRVVALYSGISRGTESLVFRGDVPESQYRAMRAPFQEGDFPAPVKYGYASVGRVDVVGAEVDPTWTGRTVFCLHPHQDRYVVPVEAVRPVPPPVPPERAVLAANVETAVNVVWDAAPGPGDRIVIVGAGVVGLLVAWLCRSVAGVELTVIDPDPGRRPVADALGLRWAASVPADADADLVIHASGSPDGLAAALGAAGVEGTVVEASWFGDRAVPVPLGEAFHSRRLTLRSSQVGRIPPLRAPRWSHGRRLALALDLLADPSLDALVPDESAFEDLPAVMARLSEGGPGVLCHRIRYAAADAPSASRAPVPR